MTTGTDTAPKLETYRNESEGLVEVKKIGPAGQVESVIIQGGRTFHLRAEERELIQMAAANDDQDPFRNGLLTLLSGGENRTELAKALSSPNHLTDDDMAELLGESIQVLRTRVETIANPVTLKRLLEVASAKGVNANKQAVVATRLETVTAPPQPPTQAGNEPDAPPPPGTRRAG